MKSKKRFNPDGSTNKIIVHMGSGAYVSFTPIDAARMIMELTAQLNRGIPMNNDFKEQRQ